MTTMENLSTKLDQLLTQTKSIDTKRKADREAVNERFRKLQKITQKRFDGLKKDLDAVDAVLACLHDEIKYYDEDEDVEEEVTLSERVVDVFDCVRSTNARVEGLEEKMIVLRVAEKKEMKVVKDKVASMAVTVGRLSEELVEGEGGKLRVLKRVEEVEAKVDEVLVLLKQEGSGGCLKEKKKPKELFALGVYKPVHEGGK